MIEFGNILIFLIGVGCVLKGLKTVAYHAAFVKKSSISIVITAFIVDDVFDGLATLCFASNTFYRTLLQLPPDQLNDMNPVVAMMLRLVIFSTSYAALHIADKAALKQEEFDLQCDETVMKIQARLEDKA